MAFIDSFPLFRQAPDYPGQVPLDPQAQGLVNDAYARSIRPTAEHEQDLNKNVNLARGFIQNPEQSAQQAKRLGSSDSMTGALRSSYANYAGDQINEITQRNKYGAELKRAQDMSKLSRTLLAQEQVKMNSLEALNQAYIQNEAARAQFINSLFQLGNAAMGTYAGNKKSAERDARLEKLYGNQGQGSIGGYSPMQNPYPQSAKRYGLGDSSLTDFSSYGEGNGY